MNCVTAFGGNTFSLCDSMVFFSLPSQGPAVAAVPHFDSDGKVEDTCFFHICYGFLAIFYRVLPPCHRIFPVLYLK